MGDALDRLTTGLSVPTDDSLVRLARLVHVKGYRRQGDGGDTERVRAYVRKDLDASGIGRSLRGAFTGPARTYLPSRSQTIDAEATKAKAQLRTADFVYGSQRYAEKHAKYNTAVGRRWNDYQQVGYGWDYHAQNDVLRGPASRERTKLAQTWDRIFDQLGQDTPDPMTFYRGLIGGGRAADITNAEPGAVFTDDGVTSATHSVSAARGFLTNFFHGDAAPQGSVLLELHVPKGTRVVGGHTDTFETMLKPGTSIRVKSVTHQPSPSGYAGDVTYVVADVLPDDPLAHQVADPLVAHTSLSHVELAGITHVDAYRRQGDGGKTEHVRAYVRKDLGSFGGLNAKTRRGIFAPTGTTYLPAMAALTGPPLGWRPTKGEPFNPYMSQEQVDAYRAKVKQAYRTKGATVEFRKDVTPEQRDRLLNAVKDVSTRLPLGYPLYVVVDSPKQTGHIGHMLTSTESKRITVLPENLTQAVPESANKSHMAAFARDPLLFDLAHEVGHVVDATQEDTANARPAGKFWRDQSKTGGLSHYGKHRPDYAPGSQGDRAEGYAEAFAQYLLGEPGDDPAQQATAQAYAEKYGWDRLTKRQKPISWGKPSTALPLLADPKTGFRRKSSSGAKVATYTADETRAWLAAHPVDPKNIIAMYDAATPEEHRKGPLWYPQAHAIATEFSKEYGVSHREAAGMIAAYSPQAAWGANMVRASEVLRTRQAVGGPKASISIVKTPNDLQEKRVGVFATGDTKKSAQKILDGQDFEEVFAGARNKNGTLKPNSLKIRAFGELVDKGQQDPNAEVPIVVVDRHAAGVARGIRLTNDDYNYDGPSSSRVKYDVYSKAYAEAAKTLSAREGHEITPEALQATTWLARQRLNMTDIKARKKLGEHDVEDSLNYFASYDPTVAEIIDDPMVGYAQLHPDRDVRVLGQDLQQAADPLVSHATDPLVHHAKIA